MFTYKRFLSSVNVFTLGPSESSKGFLTMVTGIRLLTSVKSFRSVMITRAAEGFSTILMCIRLYYQVNSFMPVKVYRTNSFQSFTYKGFFSSVMVFHANQDKLKC